ncbi:MAG TPA: glycosyltransferase family 1 protein [Polyangiales bacterium]
MTTPRVYINGRFLSQKQTGVQRYAHETLQALDKLLASGCARTPLEVCLLAPAGATLPSLRAIDARTVGPFTGNLWEQVTLPLHAHDGVLWSFGPTGPVVRANQAVTIHDANVRVVPQTYSRAFRAWYGVTMPVLARRCQVITVSEFSRAEVARHFGAPFEHIRVSGEGWQHAARVEPDYGVLAKHGLTSGRYVLAVSSVTPHKNFAVIERALARLADANIQVVVAGDVNPRIFEALPARSLESVALVGYVTNAELRALYEHACVFAYPSLYEGFGLPPLEAMACGCPVIAANAASMPEVCGDGAWYFSPHDDAELARLIRRVVSDPAARQTLIRRGQAQLARHSWEAAARIHLAAIESRVAASVRSAYLGPRRADFGEAVPVAAE